MASSHWFYSGLILQSSFRNSFNWNCRFLPLWRFFSIQISFDYLIFCSILQLSFRFSFDPCPEFSFMLFLHAISFLEFSAWYNLDLILSWFSINRHPFSLCLSRVCLALSLILPWLIFFPMDHIFLHPHLTWSFLPSIGFNIQSFRLSCNSLYRIFLLDCLMPIQSMKNPNINALLIWFRFRFFTHQLQLLRHLPHLIYTWNTATRTPHLFKGGGSVMQITLTRHNSPNGHLTIVVYVVPDAHSILY